MTHIWAHRRASAEAPENTLAAIARAVELGADGVEIDLQRSGDGRLVVIHDETVDRTTDGRGRVVDLEWAELAGWMRAPASSALPASGCRCWRRCWTCWRRPAWS